MKLDFSFFKYLPTWLKTTMVLLLAVIGIVVFFLYSRVTNTDETLCLSCHPVIYRQWHESKFHPQTVGCYQCHSPHYEAFPEPGESLYHHYLSIIIPEKFHADHQTLNANCLRCHEDIPRQKEVKKTRIIKISHQKHFKGEKVKIDDCLVCHLAIAHDKYSIETNRPRMQGCFAGNCHKEEKMNDKKCDLCHFIKLVDDQQLEQGTAREQ